jgi:hypothetical protein
MKIAIGKVSALIGLAMLPSLASPVWTAPRTVKTIMTDNCGGTPVTAVYLIGDTNPNPYYFTVGSAASASWLSELEFAQSTGQLVQIKYESSASTTAPCGFNPGNQVYVISVNP